MLSKLVYGLVETPSYSCTTAEKATNETIDRINPLVNNPHPENYIHIINELFILLTSTPFHYTKPLYVRPGCG